ncbi:vesicle-trafficking protein SEC22a isoform X2 [Nilaparvata lugens]|uniref:vesicle-trafficking protein SEC22a isoform X2 n=1 Tax=Nilaparvata lugens TaxID=108931 RepID=UPI00193E05D7|nr:vesicle-trafficking protein SEC22a isoform X2 [Nilaparvata lugens]
MIVYALIARTKDGMALSATTDFNDEVNKFVKESKRYVKIVAKKSGQYPDRCTVNFGAHDLHFISGLGVTYLVLCDSSHPPVLAFSFLNELMKEFITQYDSIRVNLARRPYSFIEFDNFIHKTRQRYNKPQNLPTRINLSDLSCEMKLRPPFIIPFSEIEPVRNGYRVINAPQMGVGPPPKLEPMDWYAAVSILPTSLCVMLGMYRGFSALSESALEIYTDRGVLEYDGPSPTHGLVFLFEGFLRIFQLYLLVYHSRYRIVESWVCMILLVWSVWLVWDLRDTVQKLFFIASAIGSHISTISRRLSLKLPEYNV